MKKNMFLVASIVTASVCGMETDISNSWAITFGGTKINLNKRDMLDTYADGEKKVDFIVVGHYTQSSKFSYSNLRPAIGDCWQEAGLVFFATNNHDNNYTIVRPSLNGEKMKALFPQ